MPFNPSNPDSPQDLYATFDINSALTGLIYHSDQGDYTRVNGKWYPLDSDTNPFGSGAPIVFVSPDFIDEFDARMMYRESLSESEVAQKYGVKPDFGVTPS